MMKNEFLTKDLYVAAFLYAKNVSFQKIHREGRICWFVFENKNTCEQLQNTYFAKTGQVIAKEYADALRTLKDLVFAN